jgi:hypothetical protein
MPLAAYLLCSYQYYHSSSFQFLCSSINTLSKITQVPTDSVISDTSGLLSVFTNLSGPENSNN